MGEAFITRRGGIGSEQALAPTITEVSTTQTSITFTITNNDASTAVILYEVGDTTPDANSIELATGATSGSLTISGLSPGTVDLYATANVTGKVKSNVTEKEFTLVDPFTAATGGTTEEYDSSGKRFRSHTFTSNGTFTVTNVGELNEDRNKVDYLVIAGGGSGGGGGGGGGAGGYRTTNGTSGANSSAESKVTVSATSYSVTIGAGGSGVSTFSVGNSGANSSIAFSSTITSTGGGAGGAGFNNALNGGSGGGSGAASAQGTFTTRFGTGTSGQGFDGGRGVDGTTSSTQSGGGGAAGQIGGDASTAVGGKGGNGGNGLDNLIRTGLNETRAGGGGGGSDGASAAVASGGSGGGGNGKFQSTAATAATANTGSGGGGGGFGIIDSAAGGSGLVVIRYEIAPSV